MPVDESREKPGATRPQPGPQSTPEHADTSLVPSPQSEPAATSVTDASTDENLRNADEGLYRIAYEQSTRALEEQRIEVDGIRQRAAGFMALVVSATAFLLGTGLKSGDRNCLFWTLSSLGTAATAAAILATYWTLKPSNWENPLSGKRLITEWIEPKPQPEAVDFLRQVTLVQEDTRTTNEGYLKDIRKHYLAALVSGGVAVLFWATLLWTHASP